RDHPVAHRRRDVRTVPQTRVGRVDRARRRRDCSVAAVGPRRRPERRTGSRDGNVRRRGCLCARDGPAHRRTLTRCCPPDTGCPGAAVRATCDCYPAVFGWVTTAVAAAAATAGEAPPGSEVGVV